MSAPQNLRLNLLKTPCHLRRSRLALSWAAPADQTAYRVVVAQGCANAEEGIESVFSSTEGTENS